MVLTKYKRITIKEVDLFLLHCGEENFDHIKNQVLTANVEHDHRTSKCSNIFQYFHPSSNIWTASFSKVCKYADK